MAGNSKPKLLSSGNPQIPIGDGDGPVQAYIEAMPGWKNAIGRKIDDIIARVFPGAEKAVKWNTPLYGKDDGWFLALYCYKKYVQITFMQGTRLDPVPPVESKVGNTRYFNIFEEDPLDETQIENWIVQAIKLPGTRL